MEQSLNQSGIKLHASSNVIGSKFIAALQKKTSNFVKLDTDRDLIRKVAAGDREAMRTIYDTYSKQILNFAKNWLADPIEASDIVHETMMHVWQSADKFADHSSLKTWILSIAKYKAIDRNGKGAGTISQDVDPKLIDNTPCPHAALESMQSAKHVRKCLEQLSPIHKNAIQYAFFNNLTYAEIAEIEGCPVGTVKTRVMHAKTLLLDKLQSNTVA